MGLDLYLVKNTNLNPKDVAWEDDIELCYGRKTWNIKHFFGDRSEVIDGDWIYRVPESAWNEFEKTVERAGGNLEELSEIVDRYFDELVTDDEVDRVVRFVESFEDLPPTLGYDWEASAILRWYNEKDRVREAFKDTPDSIYLIASY